MVEIIATPEQAAALQAAQPQQMVVLKDSSGNTLGELLIHRELELSDEELAAIKHARSVPGPVYTTREVLDYCRSLAPE